MEMADYGKGKWPVLALECELEQLIVTEVTNRLCLCLQLTPKEMVGKALDGLLTPASKLYFLSAVEPNLRQGNDCEQVTLYFKAADGPRMFLVNAVVDDKKHFSLILMQADRHLTLERQLIRERDQTKEINQELQRREQELLEQRALKSELLSRMESVSSELLQTEKLAALGQLAAGIAHEINNPVGYIRSNLNTLSQYSQRLLDFIHQNQVISDAQKESVDLAFLEKDLLSLLNETNEGIQRITQITRALTQFTRSSGLQDWCDIHKQIDTTLQVMRGELRSKVDIDRNYLPDLPLVYCDPAKVNQVLMNVLLNAADAIERFGVIRITTKYNNEQVEVIIEDNGCGMDEETAKKALEPFYTTKPEGEGTGLGLSISYSIMVSLGGSLRISSQLGEGTRIYLAFPVPGNNSEDEHGI